MINVLTLMQLGKVMIELLHEKVSKNHIRNELHHHDPDFIDEFMPYFELAKKYFQYEAVGLEHIPKNKGCLLVMNHGIIPYHGFLLTKEVIQKRGIYPRGLGAGFLFDIPYVRDFFLKGGAVNANNYNARRLLKEKNLVFLAPGGIYEGLVCEPGMTRIPWERRMGFVKLAMECNVPIIPSYCQGIHDVYYNSKFLLWWRIKLLEATRFSVPLFFGIGLLPLPKKLVHFIGKPISTRKKKGETKKEQLSRLHQEVLMAMKKLQALES